MKVITMGEYHSYRESSVGEAGRVVIVIVLRVDVVYAGIFVVEGSKSRKSSHSRSMENSHSRRESGCSDMRGKKRG